MKSLSDIIEILKVNKIKFSDKYNLSEIAIFGSYIHGTQTVGSDIDILVDFNRPIGLEFVDLALELEQILKIKVDLVSKNGIKPIYFKQLKQELIYI